MTATFYSMCYSIASLLLGFGAWLLAGVAVIQKRSDRPYQFSAGSFAMCAFSLLFQLLEVELRAGVGDFAAIDDTIRAVVLAAYVLVGVTLVLNALAVLKARRLTGG